MSTPTKVVQKCNTCGGNLFYSPSKNGLVCRSCGNFVSVTGTVTTEKSFQDLLKKAPKWQKGTTVVQCEHCGAKSVVSKFDLVAKCDYCGVADLVKTEEVLGLCPDTVVPFNVGRIDAFKRVNNWLSKRFFVPSDFRRLLRVRQLNGIYYPAFTFDVNVATQYHGTLVKTTSATVMIDGKETTQTHTVRHLISGVDEDAFDDVLIWANDEITPQILNRLQVFDTNHGQTFKQSYLAGYSVCSSAKEPQKCWNEAKNVIENKIQRKITARYTDGNCSVENLQLSLDYTNITYKHVLLPFYVGHVEYKGAQYPLYMNGQNGKIYGKTPKSWWKILLTGATMGLLALGFGIFLAMFL